MNFQTYYRNVIVLHPARLPLILKESVAGGRVVTLNNFGKVTRFKMLEIPGGHCIGKQEEYVIVLTLAGINHERVRATLVKRGIRGDE